MATPLLTLDRPRALRWTHRAEARLGSVAKPPQFSDLVHRDGRRAFFALCVYVWAALADKDAPFADYEEIAGSLHTPEQQLAAFEALLAALIEAGVIAEKKTTAPDANASANGHGLSSNAERPAPPTTTPPPPNGSP